MSCLAFSPKTTSTIISKMTHSTETAHVVEKTPAVRLGKLSSTLTLLTLSAALCSVNRKNLLCVLMSHGLRGTAWWSFAFYSRRSLVSDDPSCKLSLGVPQELSVWSSFCFLFFFFLCALWVRFSACIWGCLADTSSPPNTEIFLIFGVFSDSCSVVSKISSMQPDIFSPSITMARCSWPDKTETWY